MTLENIIINYDNELKKLANKLEKELKQFVCSYGKILALSKQKSIEINLISSDKLEISMVNRMINIKLFSNINIKEISSIIKNKIIYILEKDKVFVPDYIKEQINETFDLNKKIKENQLVTNNIIEEINKK